MTAGSSHEPFWFREATVPKTEDIAFYCLRRVYSGRSRFQQIDIVDTTMHGRMLFLDGVAQSAERDEFIYHEALVHPAMFSVEQPRSVLLIGGAEGATLREILRHPTVERVVMVDIDGELIDVCKQHLPQWHQGSYEDPRVDLVVQDGRQFVSECRETFDAVVIDLSDPEEGSPALLLFTREFYRLIAERMKPGGCVTVQGEGVSPQELVLHARITNTLKSVFPVVRPYTYTLHSFHRPDGHILASTDLGWSVDALAERAARSDLPLLFFSPHMASSMFHLPPYLLRSYETYDRILTDQDPNASMV